MSNRDQHFFYCDWLGNKSSQSHLVSAELGVCSHVFIRILRRKEWIQSPFQISPPISSILFSVTRTRSEWTWQRGMQHHFWLQPTNIYFCHLNQNAIHRWVLVDRPLHRDLDLAGPAKRTVLEQLSDWTVSFSARRSQGDERLEKHEKVPAGGRFGHHGRSLTVECTHFDFKYWIILAQFSMKFHSTKLKFFRSLI